MSFRCRLICLTRVKNNILRKQTHKVALRDKLPLCLSMEFLKAYKSFINSRNLSEGVRTTVGVATPALVLSYFNLLAIGIVMSVGALCVAATDNPGPVHHRKNGMLACNVLIFFTALIVGLAYHSAITLGIILFVLCFIFSMIGVYGTRETSIGIAALLVMVLNLQHSKQGWDIASNALYILSGGIWFMCFSLLLYRLRPYKLIQQSLGDYIESTADYLRTRATLFKTDVQYNDAYHQLFLRQISLQEKQNMVSELLFKTRIIIQETTLKGRILVMIYLDVTDIFERVMTSYQQYDILHNHFAKTSIMEQCRMILIQLADELENIGISVKSGEPSIQNNNIGIQAKELKEYFHSLRSDFMNSENLEGFVGMGRIIESLDDLINRINTLRYYTTYNPKIKKRSTQKIPYNKLADHKEIEPGVFFDNLNFTSNIFRHSLRVSVAVLTGYIISLLLHTGHSYWILLTIIVILKPAYSLTKKRNKDRLIGTFCGVIIGVLLLFIIKNNIVLLSLMLLFMAGCYVFLRTNYFISVLLMTPYLLIFFHLLSPADFKTLLTDRLIDTAIGSVIAFFTSIFFIPTWEYRTIKSYMTKTLEDNSRYYNIATRFFYREQPPSVGELHLARKNAFVSLANLSDAFTRMLSEPKRQQKEIKNVHRFVVLNHILASHIATISYYLQTKKELFRSPVFELVVKETIQYFTSAIKTLESEDDATFINPTKQSIQVLNDQAGILMEKRKQEVQQGILETNTKDLLIQTKPVTDQFNYVFSIAEDINKICGEMHLT